MNKKVDVFRDTIKAMGPEIEDIVRRETFDVMKGHLEEYSKRLQGSHVYIFTAACIDVFHEHLRIFANDYSFLAPYTCSAH